MSEWRECSLGKIITLKRGHDLPSSRRFVGDYPVYSSSGITGYHNECKVFESGVITGRYGTIGKVFFADSPHWPLNTTLYVENFHGNDKRFIYYLLQTIDWGSFADIASAVPGINRNHVHKAIVAIPILRTQQIIAEVLSSLDDKIDLLTRQNKTLESLAATYFRQWFCKGERTITVSDIADLKCISVNPAKDPLVQFYHYSIPAYDNSKTPSVEIGKEILSNKYVVEPNSILVSKLNPITPRNWFIGDSVADNSVCSTEFQVLLPKNRKYQYFLYCLMNSYDVVQDFAQSATGTSGSHQRIQPEQITQTEAFSPDESLLDRFNVICVPMFTKISINTTQIRTLQNLRDTLLPKLISGEVRVKFDEEVAS